MGKNPLWILTKKNDLQMFYNFWCYKGLKSYKIVWKSILVYLIAIPSIIKQNLNPISYIEFNMTLVK